MKSVLICYLIVINLIAFFLMGADKIKARNRSWRIPEKTLLGAAFIGGSLGGLCGMFLFHHKTRHFSFRVLIPLFFLVHILILFTLIRGGVL